MKQRLTGFASLHSKTSPREGTLRAWLTPQGTEHREGGTVGHTWKESWSWLSPPQALPLPQVWPVSLLKIPRHLWRLSCACSDRVSPSPETESLAQAPTSIRGS